MISSLKSSYGNQYHLTHLPCIIRYAISTFMVFVLQLKIEPVYLVRSVKLLNNLNRFEIENEIRRIVHVISLKGYSPTKAFFTHATCEKIRISRVCICFCYTPFISQPNPD